MTGAIEPMQQVKIFGIKNCDTMKKAIKWLKAHNVDFHFHDYKKESIDKETLRTWLEEVEWEQLINRRGTSWRKLTEQEKSDVDNEKAIELILTNTSLIKRPALLINDSLTLGFNEAQYAQLFAD
jgi:arsenate reductase